MACNRPLTRRRALTREAGWCAWNRLLEDQNVRARAKMGAPRQRVEGRRGIHRRHQVSDRAIRIILPKAPPDRYCNRSGFNTTPTIPSGVEENASIPTIDSTQWRARLG